MALDTTGKRLTIVNDFTMITPPPDDGVVGFGDRMAALDLYSGGPLSPDFVLAPARPFATREYNLVKLTIPGTVGPAFDFFFTQKLGPPAERLAILLGLDVRPYILGEIKGRPTKIAPDRAVTERSRITLNMHEDGDAPPFPAASFDVTTGGEFWRRLRAAQPDYIGATVEIRRGDFQDGKPVPNTFGAMAFVFKGRLEAIDLQGNGAVSLVCKDSLALRDRTQPAAIADDNLVDGAMLATDVIFSVDDPTQFTDPASLDSLDYFGVVVKIEDEFIMLDAITSTLQVLENYADKSEDFSDAAWVKSPGVTVIANADTGPLGGTLADLIQFAAVEVVSQVTARASGSDHVASFWIRDPNLSDGDTSEIRIFISSVLVAQVSKTVTLTNRWQRFDVTVLTTASPTDFVTLGFDHAIGQADEILVFGAALQDGTTRRFYVGTSGNAGADAGRGAFGTTAASHADDTAITEILPYRQHLSSDGVHPVVILRDLVNRAGIAAADVDQDSFDTEFSFISGSEFKRFDDTLIVDNTRLSQHVKDVREQGLIDLWVSEEGKIKVRLSFRNVSPGETALVVTDEVGIMASTLVVRNNQESRITDAIVYFDLKAGAAGNSPSDFSRIAVFAEIAIAQLSGPTVKRFFSKWIFRNPEGLALIARYVNRFRRGARIAKFRVDKKDEGNFDVGDPIVLNSVDILKKIGSTASRFDSLFQVIQKSSKRAHVEVEALEAIGLRPFFITPSVVSSGFPTDYDNATEADRQFGFIGTDPDNTVGADAEDGYYII